MFGKKMKNLPYDGLKNMKKSNDKKKDTCALAPMIFVKEKRPGPLQPYHWAIAHFSRLATMKTLISVFNTITRQTIYSYGLLAQ